MASGKDKPRDWRSLHLWQVQGVRDVLAILAVFGILYLGHKLSVVTVPILLALLLAYLFEPLVRRMTRERRRGQDARAMRGFSRQGAAAAIIAGMGVLVVVPVTFGLGFAIVQGVSLAGEVAENIEAVNHSVMAEVEPGTDPAVRERLRLRVPKGFWQWVRGKLIEYESQRPKAEPGTDSAPATAPERAQAQGPGETPDGAAEDVVPGSGEPEAPVAVIGEHKLRGLPGFVALSIDWLRANAETVAKQALRTGAGAIGAVAATIISIGKLAFMGFLTAFFFYFFCTGYGKVLAFWESLIPERKKGRAFELLAKMDRVISGFVRGRLTICAVQSVFYTVAYWAIGAPAPLLLGPFVGILSIAPYVPLIGVPISILLMWLEPSGVAWQNSWWWVIFAPIVVYWIGQAMDDYVLSPMIQGKATDMDTPTILFASLAGGALAGFYGLLLAIPVAACLKIVIKEVVWPRFKAWAEGREADFLPIDRG